MFMDQAQVTNFGPDSPGQIVTQSYFLSSRLLKKTHYLNPFSGVL